MTARSPVNLDRAMPEWFFHNTPKSLLNKTQVLTSHSCTGHSNSTCCSLLSAGICCLRYNTSPAKEKRLTSNLSISAQHSSHPTDPKKQLLQRQVLWAVVLAGQCARTAGVFSFTAPCYFEDPESTVGPYSCDTGTTGLEGYITASHCSG